MEITKKQLREEIEKLISIPCCHITGMHDPSHFDNKEYVCETQLTKAFINLLKELGIERIKVESVKDCYWCNYDKTHPSEKTKHSYKEYFYMVNTGKIEK